MDAEHGTTVDLYAQRLLGLPGEGWRMVAVDPDGADLRRESAAARLPSPVPVADVDAVWGAFVDGAQTARSR